MVKFGTLFFKALNSTLSDEEKNALNTKLTEIYRGVPSTAYQEGKNFDQCKEQLLALLTHIISLDPKRLHVFAQYKAEIDKLTSVYPSIDIEITLNVIKNRLESALLHIEQHYSNESSDSLDRFIVNLSVQPIEKLFKQLTDAIAVNPEAKMALAQLAYYVFRHGIPLSYGILAILVKEISMDVQLEYLRDAVSNNNIPYVEAFMYVAPSWQLMKQKGFNLIETAAKSNTTAMFARLAVWGADLNQANEMGNTAAHTAATEGCVATLITLKALGADIHLANKSGLSPLQLAVIFEQIEIITCEELQADLNRADRMGYTLMHFAAKFGHVAAIIALQERGVDINKANVLKQKPIVFAVKAGHIHAIDTLYSMGADIHAVAENGETLASQAVKSEQWAALAKLKALGLNLNQESMHGYKLVPLALMVSKDVNYALEQLHALGADLHQTNKLNGMTLVHTALIQDKIVAVSTLKRLGVDLNQGDARGKTPVYWAVERGKKKELDTLIALDADVNKPNHNGMSPLFFAAQNGYLDIVKQLLNAPGILIKPSMFSMDAPVCKVVPFSEESNKRLRQKINDRSGEGDAPHTISLWPRDIAYIMGHDAIVTLFDDTLKKNNSVLVTHSIFNPDLEHEQEMDVTETAEHNI